MQGYRESDGQLKQKNKHAQFATGLKHGKLEMETTLYLSCNNMIFQTFVFFFFCQPTFCLLLKFFLPSVTMVGMRFGFCDAGVVQSISVLQLQIPQQKFDWFSKYQITISGSSSCGKELGN